MKDDISLQMSLSTIAQAISAIIYAWTVELFDHVFHKDISMLIGYCISNIVDFLLQHSTFLPDSSITFAHIGWFVLSDICILLGLSLLLKLGKVYKPKIVDFIMNQLDLSDKYKDQVQNKYSLIINVIIANVLFLTVYFPLRKFFVFVY